MTKYQVHVHLADASRTHGVAEFDSMTEAYCYLIDLIAQLIFFVRGYRDAQWLGDEMVHLIGDDGSIVGTATVVSTDTVIH